MAITFNAICWMTKYSCNSSENGSSSRQQESWRLLNVDEDAGKCDMMWNEFCRHIKSKTFTPEDEKSKVLSCLESAHCGRLFDYERFIRSKENNFVKVVIWIEFIEVIRRRNSQSFFAYGNLQDFLAVMAYSHFSKYPHDEQSKLMEIANWANVMFEFVRPKGNKDLFLAVVPKLVEGLQVRYVTGGGQMSKATRARVCIYETEGLRFDPEGGHLPVPRPKKRKAVNEVSCHASPSTKGRGRGRPSACFKAYPAHATSPADESVTPQGSTDGDESSSSDSEPASGRTLVPVLSPTLDCSFFDYDERDHFDYTPIDGGLVSASVHSDMGAQYSAGWDTCQHSAPPSPFLNQWSIEEIDAAITGEYTNGDECGSSEPAPACNSFIETSAVTVLTSTCAQSDSGGVYLSPLSPYLCASAFERDHVNDYAPSEGGLVSASVHSNMDAQYSARGGSYQLFAPPSPIRELPDEVFFEDLAALLSDEENDTLSANYYTV